MLQLRTVLLLGALTGLLLVVGNAIAGEAGLTYALVFAAIMNLGAYWFSDKLVLAMTRAREVGPRDAPDLWNVVRRVAEKSNVPMPKVYIVDQPQPNAFATGRDPQHAAVAATTGILQILDARELEGVLAHELGHVLNRDTLVSAIAATIGGAITYLAYMAMWFGGGRDRGTHPLVGLLAFLLAPLAATLIRLAISRGREFGADEAGARTTNDPLALASALAKLENARRHVPMDINPATAHIFFVNPLSGEAVTGLFSTHPPTAERIRRLRAMAGLAD